MFKKRFTLKNTVNGEDYVYDNGTYIDTRMMVELLNSLYEENEYLEDLNKNIFKVIIKECPNIVTGVDMNNKKEYSVKDITGLLEVPIIDGRFQEIISTQKILDTNTGIEYDGFISTDLLILLNELNKEYEELKKR